MAEQAAAQAPVSEEKKNCVTCNKPLKKAKRYYRNGKFYCNKNCFKNEGKAVVPGAKAGEESKQEKKKEKK